MPRSLCRPFTYALDGGCSLPELAAWRERRGSLLDGNDRSLNDGASNLALESLMTYRMLIDGVLTDGAASLDVVNPATGRVFVSCARADKAQLELAIAAAKRAFNGWSSRSPSERGAYLKRLADALEARLAEFAVLLTKEQGKPLDQAQGEVFGTIAALRFYAELDTPPKVLSESAHERVLFHQPCGIV